MRFFHVVVIPFLYAFPLSLSWLTAFFEKLLYPGHQVGLAEFLGISA